MSYKPNPQDAMDDSQVSEEISEFVEDSFFSTTPQTGKSDVPAEEIPVDETDFPLESYTRKAHETSRPRTTHKRRPKRKREYRLFGLPQLLATAVWLGMIVAIGVTLGRVMWVCAADVLAFGRADREVSVTITKEDTMDSIIEKLEANGLIRYPWLFQLYADLSSAEEDIVPGTFTLNTSYDYHALVNEMSSSASKREEITVQIPEGYSCRQIFQLLEDKGVATVEELEEFSAEGDLGEFWFLEGVERGDKYCLEGFLFPDTYNFYTSGGAQHALRKLLNGFENQFSQDLQDQLITLNDLLAEKMRANGNSDEYVAEHMFTVREVVTVASLIEKEAANNLEGANIASVIYNRLFSWGDTPRYLNIDAAIVYALDGKTDLTTEDLQVDSPYNTHTNTGLTPGPIANPGMASIKSALNPADTGYFYYVLNPETGEHVFSRTYDEHVAAGG